MKKSVSAALIITEAKKDTSLAQFFGLKKHGLGGFLPPNVLTFVSDQQ